MDELATLDIDLAVWIFAWLIWYLTYLEACYPGLLHSADLKQLFTVPVEVSLHNNSTCSANWFCMESAQVWKEYQICCHSLCSKLIAVFCTSVSGRDISTVQCSGVLSMVVHLSKQARLCWLWYMRLSLSWLLEAVCICQGYRLPALCAGPWLPAARWLLPSLRLESAELQQTEAEHLTPAHTTAVCTKEGPAQCFHVTRPSVHFHWL